MNGASLGERVCLYGIIDDECPVTRTFPRCAVPVACAYQCQARTTFSIMRFPTRTALYRELLPALVIIGVVPGGCAPTGNAFPKKSSPEGESDERILPSDLERVFFCIPP